ncbi:MAG: 4-alpha-glucanotransferase, partial [Acidobacteriota bacterium]|nr:4-alpha-glucanotransferase [Acidobacteriota bacterium]
IPIEGDDLEAVMIETLHELAGGPARVVLLNLEDLWLEIEPQNVPGTHHARPNWRQRMRHTLEEITGGTEPAGILRAIDRRRRERA